MISLKNISKVYGVEGSKVVALNNLTLEISEGDFISIMGTSGCGKSTLLNIIGCIDKATEGEYLLNEKNISEKKEKELAYIRNRKFSFIFQNFSLIKELSVIQNILLPLEFSGKRKADLNKVDEYLKLLGIEELKNRSVKTLSGGQQQRVAIARALVQESKIILADEPTGSLDQNNSKIIMDILKMLNDKYNKTIILVTHDINVAKVSKKLLNMIDGNFV